MDFCADLSNGIVLRVYSYYQFYLPNIEAENARVYWYKYLYYPSYNRLDSLLVGVAIAALYRFLPAVWLSITRYGNHVLATGIVVLVLAYFLCEDSESFSASVFGFPLVAFGYGLVVLGSVSPTCVLYGLKSTVTTTLATLSYAIYLTHKGIIHMTHALLEEYHLNSNTMLILSMFSCVAAGILLEILIGRPFMRWRDHLLKH